MHLAVQALLDGFELGRGQSLDLLILHLEAEGRRGRLEPLGDVGLVLGVEDEGPLLLDALVGIDVALVG